MSREHGMTGEREDGVRRNSEYEVIPTITALMLTLSVDRGILLWDFVRLQEECIVYVELLFSSRKPLFGQKYASFIDGWNGRAELASKTLAFAIDYEREYLYALRSFQLLGTVELKSIKMSKLRNNRHARESHIVDDLVVRYLNSFYAVGSIDMSLEAWMLKEAERSASALAVLESNALLTRYDAVRKYYFTSDDFSYVYGLFTKHKKVTLSKALRLITAALKTDCEKRAYIAMIMYLTAPHQAGLDLEKYWFNFVRRYEA